jgi:uncharacterized protein with HEPN domain
MYNKALVLDILQHIDEMLHTLIKGTEDIAKLGDLLETADGMLRLNGICMCLLVIGEELKKIDKHTDKRLLLQYPAIPWQDIMGMRDKIAHHYFEIDVDIVSDILQSDIPPLIRTIEQMINDLNCK